MQTVLPYLIKSIACSGILFSYYWVALRNRQFHYYNRFYLLFVIAASLLLPLLNFNWFTFKSDSDNALINVLYAKQRLPAVIVSVHKVWNWQDIVMIVAGAVSIAMIVLFTYRIAKIYQVKNKYPNTVMGEFDFINTDLKQAPFSFLNNLFWRNDLSVEDANGKQMLQHELTHIKQKHSWDKLFIETVLCICWMNPFFWIVRRELALVHEFTADEKSVKDKDAAAFAKMLLQQQYGESIFSPAQSFNYSPVKRRLFMLTNSNKTRFSKLRRFLALPVLTFTVLLFASQLQSQSKAVTVKKDKEKNAKAQSVIVQDISLTTGKVEEVSIQKKSGVPDVVVVGYVPDNYTPLAVEESRKPGDKEKAAKDAEFPGGTAEWTKYLERFLRSDVPIINKAPFGRYKVTVVFSIDKEGNVSDAKALNDPGYGTAEEAERVIKSSAKWIPAELDGEKVKYTQQQVISFEVSK